MKMFRTLIAIALLSTVPLVAVAADSVKEATATGTQSDFSVTLLGTGSVIPRADRFGASTLVQVGGMNFLFDAGRGSYQRLWQAGLSRSDIEAVFLTHLHSDHTVGLPDLFLSGGTIDTIAKGLKSRPFVIYGPRATDKTAGTKELMEGIRSAYRADSFVRMHEQRQPPETLDIDIHEIGEGVIFDKNGIKITAFPVDHGESKPAFGYRVDYDGRALVLSGDTNYRPDEPMVKVAQGVDVIIHEVLALGPNFKAKYSAAAASIGQKHTFPSDAGKLFAGIQPKLAVYSHIEWVYDKSDNDTNVISDITNETKETYSGPLLVGEDLDKIIIGKKSVTLSRPRYGLLPVSSSPSN